MIPVSPSKRRLSAGVEVAGSGNAEVRVWAPRCKRVEFVIDRGASELLRLDDGTYEAVVPGVEPGMRYWIRLDGDRLRPDPVSRFQPEGPHGPSEIIDPTTFAWTDRSWPGVSPQGQVLYEMHIGTFTPQGTWAAAAVCAVGHGLGDAQRFDEKRGHAIRKPVGLGFLGQERLKRFRLSVRQVLLTSAAR